MTKSSDTDTCATLYRFGPYRLFVEPRLLLKDEVEVPLSARSFNILVALVERPGGVVMQKELIARAWPDMAVAEVNLRVHITHLRKALEDAGRDHRYIANVPGRGYCFIAKVERVEGLAPEAVRRSERTGMAHHNLPSVLPRLIGRRSTIEQVQGLLREHRHVSIVGPGGVGKTALALVIGHASLNEFEGAVSFVDLSAVSEARLVPSTIATAVGFRPPTTDVTASLLSFLSERRRLLILDNCEHLIGIAAELTEQICRRCTDVHILSTSREVLRSENEFVHHLAPLELPPDDAVVTVENATCWPAIELFLQRARASGYSGSFEGENLSAVVEICKGLDGLALELELAACQVAVHGVQGTAQQLNNRLQLTWAEMHQGPSRHHTLEAVLDWSFHLLSNLERAVLRRLSIFNGPFGLHAAREVATGERDDPGEVAEAIANLVDKSLLAVTFIRNVSFYRLLDTTRAFAAFKLAESDDAAGTSLRHASFQAKAIEMLLIDARSDHLQPFRVFEPHLGNIRSALEWCFGPDGDKILGISLAAHSLRIFRDLSLLGEYYDWCGKALALIDESIEPHPLELQLREALVACTLFTPPAGFDLAQAIECGLRLAERQRNDEIRLNLLVGLQTRQTVVGDFAGAKETCIAAVDLSRAIGSAHALTIGEWLMGCANHYLGDQEAALRHVRFGLQRAASLRGADFDVIGYDLRLWALILATRSSWLRGFPDDSIEAEEAAIAYAEERGRPIDICKSLYTVAATLWRQDLYLAAERVEALESYSTRYHITFYQALATGYRGEVALELGDYMEAVAATRDAAETLRRHSMHHELTRFQSATAEALARLGAIKEATKTLDMIQEIAERTGEAVEMPTLLRVRAIVASEFNPASPEIKRLLTKSIALAKQQGALGLELRSAILLAQHYITCGQKANAKATIEPILARFTQGFSTRPLQTACALLQQVS